MTSRGLVVLALLLVCPPGVRADVAFFEKSVRPVLVEHCYACHSDKVKRPKGGLRLDTRDALRRGGESGPVIVPGKPEESAILKSLRHADGVPAMPPKKKLPARVIADIEKWIAMGAPDPRTGPVISPGDTTKKHWSFQPVKKSAPPVVRHPGWARTPIDRFVLAGLEKQGLSPSLPTDRRTLVRRLTFDLTGLPPTPDEVDAFVNDTRRDAYERFVDRLLTSPAYGERWGRHWLDVVRYADTAGETADFPVPDAWRYRNYVIDALNRDVPYDRFLREQLAGDLLPGAGPEQRLATGYLAIARRFGYNIIQDHHLTIEDTIDTLGKSVLGLTIGCARCHDHKYDPVTTRDYYALYGIFASTRYPFSGCEHTKVPRDLVSLSPTMNAYAVIDGKPHNARLHKRGDPEQLGPEIERRNLELFGGQRVESGSGRLQLADWLTSPDQPLTARVMVNRLWQHHFGAGLVRTPNDFGTRGEPPSHPELLDWLASRFVEEGWSLKSMHRLIVTSATYRQAGREDARASKIDPDNRLLWRYSRRRLSAEEVRDALLMVSGDLDRSPGGPHPFPPAKAWGYTQHNPFIATYDTDRRSVYLMTQRIKRHPFLALFDGPDPNASTPDRHTTTVPTQALFFLNDPFVHTRSARLAARLLTLPDSERLRRACSLVHGRAPTPDEQAFATRFLAAYMADLEGGDRPARAWAALVRVLMSSNEFVFVD